MTKSTLTSLSLCQACPVYMGFADEDDIPECVECRHRDAEEELAADFYDDDLPEYDDEDSVEIKPSRRANRRQNKRLAKARANFLLTIIESKYKKASSSKINSDEEARLIKKCVRAEKKAVRCYQETFSFSSANLGFKVSNDADSIKKLMDSIPVLAVVEDFSGKIVSVWPKAECIKVQIGFYTKKQLNSFKKLLLVS